MQLHNYKIPELEFRALLTEGGTERLELARAYVIGLNGRLPCFSM
jgi:hypothetical protein